MYNYGQLPQEFYHNTNNRVLMTKEQADEIISNHSGWAIIGEVMYYIRTRPCDNGETEMRLEQAGGLD